jgi:hypothetical protein
MEVKQEIFKRLPPGDRWVEVDGATDQVFPTLTTALEYYFQKTGTKQYFFDAALGRVYKVEHVEEPTPPVQKFSIYDD